MARQMSIASRILEDEYARLDRKRDALEATVKRAGRITGELDQLTSDVRMLLDLGVDRAQIEEALGMPSGLVRLVLRLAKAQEAPRSGEEDLLQEEGHEPAPAW